MEQMSIVRQFQPQGQRDKTERAHRAENKKKSKKKKKAKKSMEQKRETEEETLMIQRYQRRIFQRRGHPIKAGPPGQDS